MIYVLSYCTFITIILEINRFRLIQSSVGALWVKGDQQLNILPIFPHRLLDDLNRKECVFDGCLWESVSLETQIKP